jgi:excisionase family DNA binding protein
VATERQKPHAKAGESDPPEQPKDKRADYLTTRQLAEVLQVSEGTVHRLRRAGRIPAVRLTEKLIRFNLREVQRVLRQQSGSHPQDGAEPEAVQEPIPQLSFEDVYPDFGEEQ